MNRPRLPPLTAEKIAEIRTAFPELTRCDHCGQLDDSTMPTLEFNDHPGDGYHWLHEHCREFFRPAVSKPVETFVEPAEPDPGPGWLRSRFMGLPWPRPGHEAACGCPSCPVCGPIARKEERAADALEASDG
jgi:hypothetical protein